MPNQSARDGGPITASADAVISLMLEVFELVPCPEQTGPTLYPTSSVPDEAGAVATPQTLLVAARTAPSTPVGELCVVRLGGHSACGTLSSSKSTAAASGSSGAGVFAAPALLLVVRSAQTPTAPDTMLIETSELASLSTIKGKLEQWSPRGVQLPRNRRPAQPAHPPPTVAQHNHHLQMHHPSPSFGIPLNFVRPGGGEPSSSSAGPYRYGQPDLTPSGGDGGFGRIGGQPGGNNNASAGGSGGMFFGASNPVFSGGGDANTTIGRGGGPGPSSGVVDPATGLARFDPFFPQTGNAPGFRPPGTNAFPGEPDPDHLRPWNNDNQPPGGMLPGNRGRRGGGGGGFPSW